MNPQKWRRPVLGVLPGVVLVVSLAMGLLKVTFESHIVLSPVGETKFVSKVVALVGEGRTPWGAVQAADAAAAAYIQEAMAKQRSALRQKIASLDQRNAALNVALAGLTEERRTAAH